MIIVIPKLLLYNGYYIEYESNVDEKKKLLLDSYLNKIKPYLRNIIIDLQSSDTWKTHSTMAIKFISSKDTQEERVMYSTSGNIKLAPYNDANEVVNKFFVSLCSKYQDNFETSMRVSDFIFDSVQLMHYKCHKVHFKRCGSYMDSPNWIKKKKSNDNSKKWRW